MSDVDKLVDDALELREPWRYKCFISSLAVEKLPEHGCRAFDAIRKRLENDQLTVLLEMPGLSGVLGSFFAIGNRCCIKGLGETLDSLHTELLAVVLAQAPLALKGEKVSSELMEHINRLKEHGDATVRRWAFAFESSLSR